VVPPIDAVVTASQHTSFVRGTLLRTFVRLLVVAGLAVSGLLPLGVQASADPAAPTPSAAASGSSDAAVPTSRGASTTTATRSRTLPRLSAPDHYTVPSGPKFNNPLGSRADKQAILTHVVRTINSIPGYQVAPNTPPCPTDPALVPATIKISLYSMTSSAFANALIAAHQRCISVQLLMNNHLNADTSKAWGSLLTALGNNPKALSFTRRCTHGCRGGTSTLHSKFFLFDVNDSLTPSPTSTVRDVVMVGSSNMTSNATGIQWNDLYTTRSAQLIKQYTSVFEQMVPDVQVANPLRIFHAGIYETTFWPDVNVTPASDRQMVALRSIKCTGATGGAGINGRTLVLINMHAWHGDRGRYIADQVRKMYNQGCYIRILYSFMGHTIFNNLTKDTGSRMVARRTLFSLDGDQFADVYSHYKMIAASGNVGGDPAARVVWTGSCNFAERTNRDDEVMMRIPGRGTFGAYRDRWDFIKKTKSSPIWASYSEPSGGGRPPGPKLARGTQGAPSSATKVPYIDASRVQEND
jgi:phosphatidylserine/phosphatidylglycerophosphate/cardiolipin synthase-like enzyme